MKILHVITGLPKAAGTSVFCGEVANGLATIILIRMLFMVIHILRKMIISKPDFS